MIPKMIIGMASSAMASFNPNNATSQPVNVVPILEPNTTPMPAFNDISPALINEITRTEIKELEFNIAVEKIPILILLKRLLVDLLNIFPRGPSVNILNPFSRFRIPNNNMVTPTPISMRVGYNANIIAVNMQNVRKNI
jgi:hypothetical protein